MLNIKVMIQTTDNLTDGEADPSAGEQCGEECVAMVGDAFGFGGDPGFTAGDVRVIIRHGDYQGNPLTNADDLVYGLHVCFEIPSHARYVDFATMQVEVKRAIAARMPAFVLGYWVAPSFLHWNVVRDANDTGITVNDPIQGEVTRSWSEVRAKYGDQGQYVHIDRALPQ